MTSIIGKVVKKVNGKPFKIGEKMGVVEYFCSHPFNQKSVICVFVAGSYMDTKQIEVAQ